MSEDNSKFKKPNGDLTLYAFACGYIQEDKETGVKLSCENLAINFYNIKYTIDGKFHWDQVIGLGKARAKFKYIVKKLKRLKENDNTRTSSTDLQTE